MASQLHDPSITFKAWGWSENCTLLLDLLINRSITEDVFLSSCKPRADISVGTIVVAIILCLLLIGTAGGNMLVIIAISIVRKLRSPTNLLIVNLAVTDFLVSILVLPFAIAYQTLGYWPFNQSICDLYSISDVLLCTLSILSLCTISIDRYLAITKPLQYAEKRTPKRMLLMILIAWLLSAAISIPPVYGWEQKNSPFYCGYSEELTYQIYATMTAFYIPLTVMLVLYGKILVLAKQMAVADARNRSSESQTRTCSLAQSGEWSRSSLCQSRENCSGTKPLYPDLKETWENKVLDPKQRQSVVSFKTSPVVMRNYKRPEKRPRKARSTPVVVNNGRTSEVIGGSVGGRSMYGFTKSPLVLLRKRRRKCPSDQGKGETHKAVTTLGVIMGCFTICWLPFFVSQLITPIINCFTKKRFAIPPTLFQVFVWLGYGNSFLNPVIYAMFNREFRMPFLYILRFQCADINTRLRTKSFSHQYGLPSKSGSIHGNSLSGGQCDRRRTRQNLRGLSPPNNSHVCLTASFTSQADVEKPVLQQADVDNTHLLEKTPAFTLSSYTSLSPPPFSAPVNTNSNSAYFDEMKNDEDEYDLLENNPPRPSRLMSRRGSLASTRSNYDSYIPNLNAEFHRSPLPTPSSAPSGVKTWTKAREFRHNPIPANRLRRQSEAQNCTENNGVAEHQHQRHQQQPATLL